MLFFVMSNDTSPNSLEIFKEILDEQIVSSPKARKGSVLIKGISVPAGQFSTYLAIKGLVTAGNHSPSYGAIARFREDGIAPSGISHSVKCLRKKGLLDWETQSCRLNSGLVATQNVRYTFPTPIVKELSESVQASNKVLIGLRESVDRAVRRSRRLTTGHKG